MKEFLTENLTVELKELLYMILKGQVLRPNHNETVSCEIAFIVHSYQNKVKVHWVGLGEPSFKHWLDGLGLMTCTYIVRADEILCCK